eukprot:scaffold9604_cov167-Skeletonema_dohrnii-CCMP3373.AAC.7
MKHQLSSEYIIMAECGSQGHIIPQTTTPSDGIDHNRCRGGSAVALTDRNGFDGDIPIDSRWVESTQNPEGELH